MRKMTPMEDLNFGLCNIDLDIVLSAILFDFAYAFLNFPLISPARWLESVNTTMAEKRKKGKGSATF